MNFSTPHYCARRRTRFHSAAVIASALVPVAAVFGSDYYVDPAGLGPSGNGANTFTTVQGAINAVPAGSAANPTLIHVYAGTYFERITVPSNRPYLDLIGMSSNPADTVLTYNLNATSSNGAGGTVGTSDSASTTVNAANFTAANITFANSTPYGIAQAVAFLSQGDKTALSNCRFTGFQDTLYLKQGRDYLSKCYVSGTTDYIFGNSTALFDNCTINTALHASVITAPNTAPATAVGYVFRNCIITADSGVPNASVYLSRPWQYATADSYNVYLNCVIGPQIRSAGWSMWDGGNTNPGGDTRYAEYASTNSNGTPANVASRAAWSHQLTAAQADAFSLNRIFGPGNYWSSNGWPALWQSTSNGATLNNHASAYTNWGTGDTWDPFTALSRLPGVLPGDSNLDGRVDVIDLGSLATNYGLTAGASWSQGDFNYDGKVQVTDLGTLASNYGSPMNASALNVTPASIPEPAAGLVNLAAIALCRRMRRLAPRSTENLRQFCLK